jgi:hypothetical protein
MTLICKLFLKSNSGFKIGKTASEIQVMSQGASGEEALSQTQLY